MSVSNFEVAGSNPALRDISELMGYEWLMIGNNPKTAVEIFLRNLE